MSQQTTRRFSACTSKATYYSFEFAYRKALESTARSGNYIEPYRCLNWCMRFHIGTVRPDDRFREREEWYCE